MKGSNTYLERQTVANRGEVLFEQYCKENHYECKRVGFDEKNNAVSTFYDLSTLLRNLPDYVMVRPDGTYVVNVKGTANIKKKEIDLLPLMMEWFSSRSAPLVYAFCFEHSDPLFIHPEQMIDLYRRSVDKQWSDGVIYRNLNLMEFA